jgi:hypothetical protein
MNNSQAERWVDRRSKRQGPAGGGAGPMGPRSPQDAGYEVGAPYGRHSEPFAPRLPWDVQVPNQPPHDDLPIMRFIHFLKSLG